MLPTIGTDLRHFKVSFLFILAHRAKKTNIKKFVIFFKFGENLAHLQAKIDTPKLATSVFQGCQIWPPNLVKPPNGTNLGLFKINYSTFWLSLSNLTSLVFPQTRDQKSGPCDNWIYLEDVLLVGLLIYFKGFKTAISFSLLLIRSFSWNTLNELLCFWLQINDCAWLGLQVKTL